MRVLLADDEALARSRLRTLLQGLEAPVEIVAEAGDGAQAVALARIHRPQVALLDIRMPGMDGIQAALRLAELEPAPAVIFVTAYDEYALAAFEANAIAYLLKPVRAERLREALRRARALSQAQAESLRAGTPALAVTRAGRTERIPLDQIICLRADSKYVEVCHERGVALSDQSLKAIEARHPERFLRIHRNALVDPARIRELRRDSGTARLRLEGLDAWLDVSRRHLSVVKSLLKDT